MGGRHFIAAALAAVLAISAGAPLRADETGMASMHDQARRGGRLCFTDHTHSGSSSGARSRSAAMAAAISSWREFTAFEYGSTWASYSRAIAKVASCSNSSGGGWGCTIEARPCR